MNSGTLHSEDHERVIQGAIAGDLEPDDPRLQALLHECGACREHYEGLARVRTLLDETAREEREVVAELDWAEPAPGRELVGAFVREQMDQRALAARPRPWWRSAWVAAAAASILIAGWIVRALTAPRGEERTRTSLGEESESLQPSGPGSSFERFAWPGLQLPPGGRYELRVWDRAKGPEDGRLVRLDLEEQEWAPAPGESASWPDQIAWEVRVIDATGESGTSATASAAR
jgi:hypothetical protein